MKVAMMQPTFLPWQGFFELIYRSERFVLGDDSQFSNESFHQRNRLFVQAGKVAWFTVPMVKKEAVFKPLHQAKIFEGRPWREKMWRQIHQSYGRTPHFSQLAPAVEKWLVAPAESLAAQNIAFIRLACGLLGIQRELRLASALPMTHTRSGRVLDLLRWCEADQYYCARGSFGYMKSEGLFPLADIEVLFQDYVPKAYPQFGATEGFVPYLSVLDALFNIGPEATFQLISQGTARWWTWDEMVAAGDVHAGPQDDLPESSL